MNILFWHVHGSWATAFVQGKHRYLVPVNAALDEWGLGRARTFPWPETVEEVDVAALRPDDVDVIVLQRRDELDRIAHLAGNKKIFLEHNTPKGDVPNTRHPMADRDDLAIVHVTHFNDLFWDAGATRTHVIEHGVVPPAVRWTGELERLAVVTNEPVRRGRVTGTDLFPRFTPVAPVDVYGMGVAGLRLDRVFTHDDPPQAAMHEQIAHRRAYLHLCRWTSLGLSLIEAMQIGMPVIALATTEAVAAVPADAGVLATRVDTLVEAAQWLIDDPDAARRLGDAGRSSALARYGLDRFLADWDRLLEEHTCA
ncbi:glycosyltransferase involved in cell wall biosynthesis [Catenuloplanes nepalensis]|uniref:Glycosyltransferase involved in cell wall biosynthesis n=1 Tax=Catenuloplanes nepalensis TaxID=587533 RepID=A0ABT9MMQ3_9ACTN|nr:glycosyltransferase [Catenuloplanes nepalensis]MDP9792719.1 glycosyltransferase involved in cell wall biosynthesis [Catenuloplanes nepalensis]